MIPDERFSSTAFRGQLLNPWSRDRKISYQWGPVQVQDPSQGLLVKVWTLRAEGGAAILSAPGSPTETVFTRSVDIDNVNLAFDQNGRPCVCFEEEGGGAYLYWFDPVPNAPVFMPVPGGAVSPRITLDDARPFNGANSDVILGYIRDGIVRYRQQRDRFTVEYTPPIGPGGAPASASGLRHISMNSNLRLEFLTDGAGEEPWVLADVVADLLRRSDLPPEHIDVRHLYSQTVEGYRIANEGGADSNIEPLTHAWFFDPAEWDKKLRFIPRGQEPVAHLTFDDLIEQNGTDGPLEMERVQEVELLRKVNVTMVDNTAGWVSNKQTAERRSATIRAVGEQSVVLPITAHPDFTATVAAKRLRVPWGEPHKLRFGLGTPWTALTPTDVVTLEDRRGRVHQIRLGQIEEDYGSFSFETTTNANWVYEVQAQGVSPRPPIPTVPGRAGDTVVIPMDLPVLRDQDDELGYYVAVYGTGNGWGGGLVQISLDGGATVAQSIDVTVPSVAGTVLSTLLPERGSEYLSHQTLTVSLPLQPESITHEAILRYGNLAAVQHTDGAWEVLQFETVTVLGDGEYELSGLVRGRYATTPGAVDPDSPFVLLDASVMFVQMQQWMIGETVSYRGVTYNQNPDDVEWQSFVIDHPQSQTEWPVYDVRRDGDVVSWIGRARLGVEVAPHHSKYFGGYRVTYSDGHTADTMNQQYTRAGTPPGVTVTVQAINTITGVGP